MGHAVAVRVVLVEDPVEQGLAAQVQPVQGGQVLEVAVLQVVDVYARKVQLGDGPHFQGRDGLAGVVPVGGGRQDGLPHRPSAVADVDGGDQPNLNLLPNEPVQVGVSPKVPSISTT